METSYAAYIIIHIISEVLQTLKRSHLWNSKMTILNSLFMCIQNMRKECSCEIRSLQQEPFLYASVPEMVHHYCHQRG